MYSVYIYCKEKLGREEVDAGKTISPFLLLPRAGAELSLAWAPGTESGDTLPKIIGLENKYKSIIAQLKDSLGLEERRRSRRMVQVCLRMSVCSRGIGESMIKSEGEAGNDARL